MAGETAHPPRGDHGRIYEGFPSVPTRQYSPMVRRPWCVAAGPDCKDSAAPYDFPTTYLSLEVTFFMTPQLAESVFRTLVDDPEISLFSHGKGAGTYEVRYEDVVPPYLWPLGSVGYTASSEEGPADEGASLEVEEILAMPSGSKAYISELYLDYERHAERVLEEDLWLLEMTAVVDYLAGGGEELNLPSLQQAHDSLCVGGTTTPMTDLGCENVGLVLEHVSSSFPTQLGQPLFREIVGFQYFGYCILDFRLTNWTQKYSDGSRPWHESHSWEERVEGDYRGSPGGSIEGFLGYIDTEFFSEKNNSRQFCTT
jgi:hypothetical protein